MSGKANNRSHNKIVIERRYEASIEDVWELWTTSEGIESWWGPEGFSVKVHELDLKAGGQMVYAMTAVDPPTLPAVWTRSIGFPTAPRLDATMQAVAGN